MIRLSQIEWTPALRIAAACAALALVADLALVARAFSSPTDTPVVPLRLAPPPTISPRTISGAALIDSAAALQPFDPLDAPLTLADASVIIPQAMPTPVAQPRLVGTVVDGPRSFVVMALADGSIKVVRIGERGGDLRLRGVTAGGASFDDINGGRVTLRAPTPGAEPQP